MLAAGLLVITTGQYPLQCPKGKWTEKVNMGGAQVMVCNTCPKGRYIYKTGHRTCRFCRTGHYQDHEGQTSCAKCAVGMRANGILSR